MLSKRTSSLHPSLSFLVVLNTNGTFSSIRKLGRRDVRPFPSLTILVYADGECKLRLNARHSLKEQSTTVSTTNSIPLQFRSAGASMHPIPSVTVSVFLCCFRFGSWVSLGTSYFPPFPPSRPSLSRDIAFSGYVETRFRVPDFYHIKKVVETQQY